MKILIQVAAALSALALAGALVYRLFDDDRRDALRWRELCRGERVQASARVHSGDELPPMRCLAIDAEAWRACPDGACRAEVLRAAR